MPHKDRKNRKKRGSRTAGWGRIGQHRKTGQKGGRKAGRHKHLWSYVLRYDPDYFSKKGFSSSRQRKLNIVNVGKLEDLATNLSVEKKLDEIDGRAFLDLERLGYDRLLGFGDVAKPFSVKVKSYSRSAARKLEEAGGRLIIEKAK
jgi:large subunit ribosomal protein L15